jgi:hypothetical protein
MVWNKYFQEEGLDKYPEIVKLFNSDSEAMKLVSARPEIGENEISEYPKIKPVVSSTQSR